MDGMVTDDLRILFVECFLGYNN